MRTRNQNLSSGIEGAEAHLSGSVKPPLRLTAPGLQFDPASLTQLQKEFQDSHCLHFSGLLEPSLLQKILKLLDTLPFEFQNLKMGQRKVCSHPTVRGLLLMLFNREPLLRLVETVTGKPHLGSFDGNVYRLQPSSAQQLDWHDDYPGERQLAVSLSLNPRPYQGGVFELRAKGTEHLFRQVESLPAGDAILFDVAPALEHRVTPIVGEAPRTAFSGWFLRSASSSFTPASVGE